MQNSAEKPLFLFDGSLIFWHLESKGEAIQHRFLTSYCSLLQQLHDHRVLHAGYISLPKSRELVNIVRAFSEFSDAARDTQKFAPNFIVDSHVIEFFLKPDYRTIIFENRSPIVKFYTHSLRPCFFYLHNGWEIVRIEIPLWIAQESSLVDRIATVILSQSKKGNGYPVCLAEAHEQAVVTSSDRELFYAMVRKNMDKHNFVHTVSQKSAHKRILGI